MLDLEISLGHILTTISVSLAAAGLIISSVKTRRQLQQENADRIRRSAGLITAKLERWNELSLHFFSRIQPKITEADELKVS